MRIRPLLSLARHAFGAGGVAYLVLFVTSRCNARCRMCFNANTAQSANASSELSLPEIERLARSTPRLFQLVLTGGEPFLRDDVVKAALLFRRHCGVSIVSINTNGLLANRILADVERLCDQAPDTLVRINVSIDGIGETHDFIRNVPGLYERTTETARQLIGMKKHFPNLSVNVQSVLSAHNAGTMKEVFRTVRDKIRPDFHGIGWPRGDLCEPEAGKIDPSVYEELAQWLSRERVAERTGGHAPFSMFGPALSGAMADVVIQTLREQRWPMPCVAGRKMLIVRENGDVLPCELLGKQIADGTLPADAAPASPLLGNLRNTDFNLDRLLSSPEARRILAFISTGQCPCTFECAIYASLLFNYRSFPMLARRFFRERRTGHGKM